MKPLKKLFSITIVTGLILVFALGFAFTVEMIWRIFNQHNNQAINDISVFPYKHYLVTSHPANLELGKTTHILEADFIKDECASPEGVTARFNQDGFRTPNFDAISGKEENEIRIIITGGASAISWGIGESCTLDAQLYRLFEKKHPHKKVRIFNLSNRSWKSFQELLAIQLYGLKLEPDLIIALDGYNDLIQAFSIPIEEPYANHAETAFQYYKQWVENRNINLFKTFTLLESLKHQITHAIQSFKSSTHAIDTNTHLRVINQKAVDFYLRNERLMAKTASIKGAKIIFALTPTLYLKTPLSPEEEQLLAAQATHPHYVIQGYLSMKEGLKNISNLEKNAIFYDMSTLFENNPETIFLDAGHFNKTGYTIMANALFETISTTLELN